MNCTFLLGGQMLLHGHSMSAANFDYKASGVDIEAGDRLVDWITAQKKSGPHQNLMGGIGGFAALFKLDLKKYSNPILVSCTDGVGTKVKLAAQFNRVRPTGIDLVAMCVNDLIVCGADPLFFLDYYATSQLNLEQAKDFLSGVMDGLSQSQCTLVGGETAEMPGVYAKGDYDCAGFCVGAVNEPEIITGKKIKPGAVALGIEASGFHSNGYSLLRKVFEKDMDDWIDQLLIPTRIYVGLVVDLKNKVSLLGMAHITGGGIIGNAPRVLPQGTALQLKKWALPPTFAEVQKRTGMTDHQMLETLNCGVGFVLYVDRSQTSAVEKHVSKLGWKIWEVGEVVAHSGEPEVLV